MSKVNVFVGMFFLVGMGVAPSVSMAAESSSSDWQQITPDLRVGGSVRLRYEAKINFDFGAATAGNKRDYWLSQLRLNLAWQPSDRFALFVEAQDARIHKGVAEQSVNDTNTPNIFEDQLDVHQAYVDVTVRDGINVRVGRQKLNLGALRMIASLEWVNTARVWDGVRITSKLDSGGDKVDAFYTQLVPVNPGASNSHTTTGSRLFDSKFHGLYYTNTSTSENVQTEFYGLFREEPIQKDKVFTVGTRVAYKANGVDADAELMKQSGTYGGLTHNAYAMHFGVGINLPSVDTHIGTAYNFGSGDSDAADNTHETFDNMYPLNHAYYGYMDFFSLQNMHNYELVVKTKLSDNLSLRSAWQMFRLDQQDTDSWYNAGAGVVRTATAPVSSHVGNELDLTLIYKIPGYKATLIGGYSHFYAGQYIEQTGTSKDADFFFVQTKLSF